MRESKIQKSIAWKRCVLDCKDIVNGRNPTICVEGFYSHGFFIAVEVVLDFTSI